MTSVCTAAVVWVGLVGCAHSLQQGASGWVMVETSHIQLRTNLGRAAGIEVARQMQHSYDVLARYALPCAPRGDEDRVQVTVLPYWQFVEYADKQVGGFYTRAGVTWLADHDGQIVIPDRLRAATLIYSPSIAHGAVPARPDVVVAFASQEHLEHRHPAGELGSLSLTSAASSTPSAKLSHSSPSA